MGETENTGVLYLDGMSLRDCARIIEAAALLCRHKTPNGVIAELNKLTEQYGLR